MGKAEPAGIPKEGFIKVSSPKAAPLSGQQKTALIRKGNELFNAGDYEAAKRIFLTTGYTDGIIRMGDHYVKANEPLEALRMYWIAPAPDKKELILEGMSRVLHKWLKEAEGHEK